MTILSAPLSRLALCAPLLLASAGCDESQRKQEEAARLQHEVEEKTAKLQKEMAEKGLKAKAEAEQEVAKAQAKANEAGRDANESFAKTRNEFRANVQKDVDDLNKKIDDLNVKAAKAKGKAKADFEAASKDVKDKRDSLTAELKSIDSATADGWDAVKGKVERGYTDLKKAVDNASSKL